MQFFIPLISLFLSMPLLAQEDGFRDIKPAIEIPQDYTWQTMIGICLLVLGVFLFFLGRRLFKKSQSLTPYELASIELNLALKKLNENDDIQNFTVTLSHAIKRFIQKTYAIPAEERTTEEFLQSTLNNESLSPEAKAFLQDFLEKCDLVKFANFQIDKEECNDIHRNAVDFINRVHTETQQDDTTKA